jgi:hypothetical protein
MNKKNQDLMGRRSVLTGMGVAAAGVVAGAATANAQSTSGFKPARDAADQWMDELPGKHRAWIDTSYATGGMEALHYANNILSGNKQAYDGQDSDYAMVICFRHYATTLAYGDAAWARYGEIFCSVMNMKDPQSGEAYKVNPGNIAGRMDLDNGGDTIDKTLGRGVKIAICNAATHFYAMTVAEVTNGNKDEIYKELVDSAVPNSHFVAAGVLATTRAQEYGYSLLYAG